MLPMLRTSERKAYNRCRQAWWWEYVEHWKPKDERKALTFGTLIHKALEVYMPPGRKRGPHPSLTFEAEYQKHIAAGGLGLGKKDDDGEWMNGLELGIAMLNGYVEQW